jgi:hypothetical protein
MVVVCLGRVSSVGANTQHWLISAAIDAGLIPASWQSNEAKLAYHSASRLQCSASFFIVSFHIAVPPPPPKLDLAIFERSIPSDSLRVFSAVQMSPEGEHEFILPIQSFTVEFLLRKELIRRTHLKLALPDGSRVFSECWFVGTGTKLRIFDDAGGRYWRFEFVVSGDPGFNDHKLGEIMASVVFYELSKSPHRWRSPPFRFPLAPAVITSVAFTSDCFDTIAEQDSPYRQLLIFAHEQGACTHYKENVLWPQISRWYQSAEYLDFRASVEAEIAAEPENNRR